MWKEKFLTLLPNSVKPHWLALLFSSIGLALIAIGVISTILSENNNQGVIIEEAASSDRSNIFVDVEGAVLKPGVYKLTAEARIQDALIAAGGLSQEADREYVAKMINLAAKISDGAKIYVPKVGESSTSSIGSAGGVAGSVAGLININMASQSELESLPGIGPVTATKIIDNRPYSSIDDLLTKKIVGQKVFGEIKEKISVY